MTSRKSQAHSVTSEDAQPNLSPEPGAASTGGDSEDKRSAKERILDVAEELFANYGFHGTSIRAVATAAKVDVFRTHYYFGSKDELFRQVLLRRAEEWMQAFSDSLDAALAKAGNRPPSVEELVAAWLRPALQRVLGENKGWQHYLKLLYRLNSTPERKQIAPVTDRYHPVYDRFIAAFQAVLPGAAPESIRWAFYCIEQVATTINSEDHRSPNLPAWRLRITDVNATLQHVVPFYSAGFYALASRDHQIES